MQKRVVEPQTDETRTESKVARAEPSRGAPERAAKFYLKWANDSYGVYPDRKLPSEHLLHFAASFAASEHVVLLEALRHLRDRVRVVVEWPDHEDLMVEFAQELVEAEAAIKQAERTCH